MTGVLGNTFKITAKLAKKIIKVADENASDSTCMSLKRATYWHEDGYIVSGGKGVEKWVTKYYYKANYKGYAGKDTKYEVFGSR